LSRVIPLIAFGLTIVVGGLYWALWDGSRSFIDQFVVNDVYYQLMIWVWGAIPAILIIVGILCLIAAGVSVSGNRMGVE